MNSSDPSNSRKCDMNAATQDTVNQLAAMAQSGLHCANSR